MYDILVTLEVSQELMSWLKLVAEENIDDIFVTFDKSGVSVKSPIMFEQPRKAFSIEVQIPVPQLFIIRSFSLSPVLLK